MSVGTSSASCVEGWVEEDTSFYELGRGGLGPSEVTVTITPTTGDPDLYVSNDGLLPDRRHYGWHATHVGEDAITMDAHDASWCTGGCAYIVGVYAADDMPSSSTVTVATRSATVILEDGVPHQRSYATGGVDCYRVYVPA